MARDVARGEIWLYRFAEPDKRRPVLVLSRPVLLATLQTATVAAITSTLHGSPTEVEVGRDEGLKDTSCVNLANVFTVRRTDLRQYFGSLDAEKMRAVCKALSIAVGCD